MIIPMATGPEPLYQFNVMQAVTAVFLTLVIIAVLYMASKQHKLFRQDKSGIGAVLIWIGIAFVAFSVLVYASIGPTITLFASESLGLPYILPVSLGFSIFLLGLGVIIAGGLTAWLTRKPSVKKKQSAQAQRVGTDPVSQ